ncbi:hypothetical protein MINTM020_25400 [Mycobacterium paraintracellulare]|nr:hypothetical protein MINTM020_25400 [Mycobacterium paraintracellulare]
MYQSDSYLGLWPLPSRTLTRPVPGLTPIEWSAGYVAFVIGGSLTMSDRAYCFTGCRNTPHLCRDFVYGLRGD